MKTRINAHCLPILALVVVIISGITSQIVEFTGERNVNGTYGGNVTIAWNTRAKPIYNVVFHIIAGDADGEILMSTLLRILAKPQNIDYHRSQSSTLNFINRVFATYTSKGNVDSNGNVIGQVLFTITNLRFSDSGSYTIAEGLRKPYTATIQTELSVYSTPVFSGATLGERYGVKSDEDATLEFAFLGNPRPEVNWTLDGVSISSKLVTETSLHNYTYTVTIEAQDLPRPCEEKQLNYTATGYGSSVTGFITIHNKFNPNVTDSFIDNIEFSRYPNNSNNCLNITWDKKLESGNCNVQYQVDFLYTNGSRITSVNGTNTFFSVCNRSDILNSEEFKITTYVYDGNGTKLAKKHSESQSFSVTPTITTTTTTTVSTKAGGSSGVAIGAGIGGALAALIILVLLICRIKKKKAKASGVQLEDVSGNGLNNAAQDTEGDYDRVHHPNTQQPLAFRQQRAGSNDYAKLDRVPKPQGVAAAAPHDPSSMYAAVNKNQDLPKEQTIYSELGAGGGRVGPKPIVQSSHYAEAKEFAPR